MEDIISGNGSSDLSKRIGGSSEIDCHAFRMCARIDGFKSLRQIVPASEKNFLMANIRNCNALGWLKTAGPNSVFDDLSQCLEPFTCHG
jgi:hypothetical protein